MKSHNHEYDPSYYDIALQKKDPVAVLIVAYNRPEYLTKVIESLESNPESRTLPFFFFLDGGPGAKQEEITMIINHSKIKHKHIIIRNRNYGCAKNLIDARRFMFDWCKYEKIILIEEDVIVSPHYIRILLALHEWGRKRYINVWVALCTSYCFLSGRQKRKKWQLVQISENPWWNFTSYCIDREVWQAICPILYKYETFVDKIPWTEASFKERSKPGRSSVGDDIRTWVKSLIDKRDLKTASEGPQLKPNVDLRTKFASINYDVTSQDQITGFALWMAGYVKIETVVNRARCIGEYGVTVDEKMFKRLGHHKITLDYYEGDATITEFNEVSK